MSNSRTLILCVSIHHGNTAKVAAAMAAVLDAQLAVPDAMPSTGLQDRPLVGFGSGVYYGRMHEDLFWWLQGLPESSETMMPAFVFSTSGLPWLSGFWHRPLRRLLASKGFRVLGEFSCCGYDTWGPLWLTGGLNKAHPDEHDLERARLFAAAMRTKCRFAEASATCAPCG